MKEHISSDIACKLLFRNPYYFASFVNAVLFDGNQVIDPLEVEDYVSDVSSIMIKNGNHFKNIKRYRDITKKIPHKGVYHVLGVEHQNTIDQKMVVRTGIYEMLDYYNQLISGRKKLMPNIMIVFYTGSSTWKSPQRLQEMMNKAKGMEKYYNDWKYFFVDIKEIDTTKIKDLQVSYLVEAVQGLYEGDYERLNQDIVVKGEILEVVAAFTHSEELLEELMREEEINMCEGSKRIMENLKGQGREEGRQEILNELMSEEENMCEDSKRIVHTLKKEGELNNQRKIVLKQLQIKFGVVSKELMMKIDKFSSQQLNILIEHIFDISSEDDILQLIH